MKKKARENCVLKKDLQILVTLCKKAISLQKAFIYSITSV